MFMIGIDPHKGSHTAAAVDRNEAVIDTLRVDADRHQRARLLAWAAVRAAHLGRRGSDGDGCVVGSAARRSGRARGRCATEVVVRVRLLEPGRIDKTDPNDARSAAIVGLAHRP